MRNDPLTWWCEFCGELRLDQDVSVITYNDKNTPWMTINKKYCNDKEECLLKAFEKSKTGKQ